MNGIAFDVNGLHLQWPLIVAAGIVVQWIVFVIVSMFGRAPLPQSGLRVSERNLLISSALLALGWIGLYRYDPAARPGGAAITEASALGSSAGSCSSVHSGMTNSEVKKVMGKPDEVRSDEDARGPGATILIYRGSRCAVHTLDERVDFID